MANFFVGTRCFVIFHFCFFAFGYFCSPFFFSLFLSLSKAEMRKAQAASRRKIFVWILCLIGVGVVYYNFRMGLMKSSIKMGSDVIGGLMKQTPSGGDR